MYCKFCGKPIDDNSAYCNHCGRNQNTTSIQDYNDEPKRIWLAATSLVAGISSLVSYIIMSVVWHNKIMSYMGDDFFAHMPPIEALLPKEWVFIMCIATFVADLFMLLSWTKSKTKIGFNIAITVLSCLVTLISLLALLNPSAIK